MKILIDKKIDISIIIPNYKSKRYLRKNLSSICEKIALVRKEIIIINNDKEENLEDIQEEFPNIKILDHKKNVGFGAAVNLGVKKSSGKYLFFLNPDCEIISDNIEQIISEFETNKKVGIIGSQLVGMDNEIQEWIAGKEVTLWNLIRNNICFSSSQKICSSREKTKVHWVSGAAMFIKKGLFDEIGGFDERFFMYFEDVDLCKRVRKIGKIICFFPKFKVKHIGGGSCLNKKIQKRDYFDSQRYYFKKHNGKMGFCILKILQNTFRLK